MKKFVITAIMLVMMLSACGNTENAGISVQTPQASEEHSNVQMDGESISEATSKDSEGYNITWEDMEEIHMLYPSMGPVPSGLQAVEDAINEITEAQINTHVNIDIYEIGNYDQQVGLMMSSGENVDLMLTLPSGSAGFSSMQAQGQLMDISQLLEEYGQPIINTMGELIKGTMINGHTYGLCGYRNIVSGEYIIMRTDVLEDLGLLEKAENMTSFTEYEEILAQVKASEQWSYLSGIVGSGHGNIMLQQAAFCSEDQFKDISLFDNLGETYKIICIDPQKGDDVVRMTFATDEYKKIYERVKKWYDNGYIYKDSATTLESGTDLIKSNVGFSMFCDGEYGIEATKSADCDMPMTCIKLKDYPITTGSCTKFTWVIPSTSKAPEAAIAFLNMMYTDNRIANLLAWGIEGTDYEVVNGEARYIDGNTTPAYHTNDFMYGNQFITLPWEGSGTNMRQESYEIMQNATYSKYMGFSCDTSAVTGELAAVSNCLNEYRPQVETGMASEAVYNDFMNKLQASGVEKIVDCYQQQLNTWLEGYNK